MFKVILLVSLVGGFVLTALKRHQSRKNLSALDQGEMCFHCESRDVRQEADGIHCGRCGQFTSADLIRSAGVSEAELKALTEVPRQRF